MIPPSLQQWQKEHDHAMLLKSKDYIISQGSIVHCTKIFGGWAVFAPHLPVNISDEELYHEVSNDPMKMKSIKEAKLWQILKKFNFPKKKKTVVQVRILWKTKMHKKTQTPIGSMYGLFTYIRWKIANIQGEM